MARKKKMDKLSQEVAQALACGMSYGKWKAKYGKPVEKKEEKTLPEKWQICPWCGKEFKRKGNARQIYCEPYCQREAGKQRARDRKEALKNERI